MDFGRSTTAKAALALAGALAIAGAIGTAVAMSPIVQPPIKWQGGVEFGAANAFIGSGPQGSWVYRVPSGRSLILTDLVLSNNTDSASTVQVFSAPDFADPLTACVQGFQRLYNIVVPPRSTTSLNLQTGIGFASGQYVCLTMQGLSYNARGFLFTAAPAS